MSLLEKHLVPPHPSLFFTRNDAADPRMGELTLRDIDEFPGRARVALIGVPQDIGVYRNGGRVGAADAPDAIRGMLYRLTPFDIETGENLPPGFLVDLGNIRVDGELEEIHGRLTEVVTEVCRAGVLPVVLGGGHDVTYAAAAGVAAAHGPLGMINMDAHLDVRQPNPLRNSGTSFRMLIEEKLVRSDHFVELGIQSFVNAAEHVRWITERGGQIITLDEIRTGGFTELLATAYLNATPSSEKVYVSLDMDGVRSADAPGVSATMSDGLTAAEFMTAARSLGRRPYTVALDLVEVNPAFDTDNRTAKLAAHGLMRFFAGIAERERVG